MHCTEYRRVYRTDYRREHGAIWCDTGGCTALNTGGSTEGCLHAEENTAGRWVVLVPKAAAYGRATLGCRRSRRSRWSGCGSRRVVVEVVVVVVVIVVVGFRVN